MCGIGGCIGEQATTELVRRMSALTKHRGPDDYGEYVDRGAALFSNRLSIIDVEGGHQPIFNEDGTLAIVFNGEIYNFAGIREELEKKGHRFSTRSDTEVILHGFEEYGPAVFGMLDGMFAVAIWDVKTKRLTLARDRVGIKPLFYAKTPRGDLVFCSEVKGVLAHPDVKAGVNTDGLYYLMSLYYIPFEATLFSGVWKVPPGSYYDSSTGAVSTYWSPPRIEPGPPPDPAVIRDALEQSVERQLVSDVEVSTFLSGGLDSSTVTAFASKHYPQKLKTFCLGFGHDDDELADAKMVAEHFGTDHHELTISDRMELDLYPKMIWHTEEPKLNTYGWFVNQFASRYVKVCLSGLGGDELFFGYPTSARFTSFRRAQGLMKYRGASLLSAFSSGKRKAVLSNVKDRTSTYLTLVSPVYRSIDDAVFSAPVTGARGKLTERMRGQFFGDPGAEFVQQAVRAEFGTKLTDDFLLVEDAMSMAHSLEARVPLLDNQLLDLMLPVPYRFNYENDVGKVLLRKAMTGILPPECFEKPKHGFSLNIVKWWSGEFGEEIRNALSGSEAVKRYFNAEALRKLIPAAKDSYSTVSFLWHVYGFHIWHGLFLEGGKDKLRAPAPGLAK
ncbi:MAG: asparagine synthase (glutamine-hydrolyzing) [Nitrososphaerota archaeon]|nr:asparagine synthase (glutamine-hydrolyzing) [Nitrososphaerota archaeon]